MEKMLDAFKTNITPVQAMKLFTAPKDGKGSWPEHYMYLVAIYGARGNSDYMVLTSIVQYASAELRTVLMAKVGQTHAEELAHFAQSLGRETVNSNPGRASLLKVLTGKSPQLGEIVVFGSPCTVYREPRKKNFVQRAQTAMIVGVGEETKGHRVYLPKDRVVVTTQHVKNIESLNKE
ncbi:hypothetical protein PR003_g16748 [Phytophthora rubi]|uniref:Retroviral polymerase SH3-like domain-containing protein n=1 Tax=Phytophthora rubi TaxID=129364 RepID=A0A6A4EI05_9STRA|nr:hypothetical protein PR001_g16210 [Phytophthora rubi]KAE9324366.1 hypothetical protein PR003_g16748 [Phytophthora rubi]